MEGECLSIRMSTWRASDVPPLIPPLTSERQMFTIKHKGRREMHQRTCDKQVQ